MALFLGDNIRIRLLKYCGSVLLLLIPKLRCIERWRQLLYLPDDVSLHSSSKHKVWHVTFELKTVDSARHAFLETKFSTFHFEPYTLH